MKLCKTYLFLLLAVTTLSVQATEHICILKGKVVDRSAKAVLLLESPGDIRKGYIRIPVTDQSFEYRLLFTAEKAYQLIFEDEYEDGAWRPVIFFSDTAQIKFVLYPKKRFDENRIEGGPLNKAFQDFQNEETKWLVPLLDSLNKKREILKGQGDYTSPAYDSLMSQLRRAETSESRKKIYEKIDKLRENHEDLTNNGKLLNQEFSKLNDRRIQHRYAYIRQNLSLVSLYFLLSDLYFQAKEDTALAQKIKVSYEPFVKKFSKHPYVKEFENQVSGLQLRKPGSLFVDFTAPDLNGKLHTFSALLKGRITLLDLWGSWCGPCIAASRLMLPVYQEFRDKGFQVIGVAREFKNTQKLKAALLREKYPWLNLIDLDDRCQIWSKYNISNSGGSIFLFDKDGKILAVNPTAEEVRKVLKASL